MRIVCPVVSTKKLGFFVINLPRFFLRKVLTLKRATNKNPVRLTKNPNFFEKTTGQTIRKFYSLGIFNILSNTINITQKWCASQKTNLNHHKCVKRGVSSHWESQFEIKDKLQGLILRQFKFCALHFRSEKVIILEYYCSIF